MAAGLRQDPLGSFGAPIDPVAAIDGPTSKGREGERMGRERRRGLEGKGRDGNIGVARSAGGAGAPRWRRKKKSFPGIFLEMRQNGAGFGEVQPRR